MFHAKLRNKMGRGVLHLGMTLQPGAVLQCLDHTWYVDWYSWIGTKYVIEILNSKGKFSINTFFLPMGKVADKIVCISLACNLHQEVHV